MIKNNQYAGYSEFTVDKTKSIHEQVQSELNNISQNQIIQSFDVTYYSRNSEILNCDIYYIATPISSNKTFHEIKGKLYEENAVVRSIMQMNESYRDILNLTLNDLNSLSGLRMTFACSSMIDSVNKRLKVILGVL